MKRKNVLSSAFALLLMMLPLTAKSTSATLSIEPLDIKAGETQEMVIDLTNPQDELTLVQFDLHLPAGLNIRQTGGDLDIDMCDRTTWRKHTLDANKIEDGHYRFLLYSGSNALISGTEGALIKVTLTASAGFSGGSIVIDEALLVSPDQKETKPEAYTYKLGGSDDGDWHDSDVFTAATAEGAMLRFRILSVADKTCQVGVLDEDGAATEGSTPNWNEIGLVDHNGKWDTITIPAEVNGFSVTGLASNAFAVCSDVQRFILPGSIIFIGNGAFGDCYALKEVLLPDHLERLGSYIFSDDFGLESISFPKSLKTIGDYLFENSSPATIRSEIEYPMDASKAFASSSVTQKSTLYVPAGTKARYLSTPGWKDFVNIVEMSGGSAEEEQGSRLSIEPFGIKAGETQEMVIDLTNPQDELTLVQFDLHLPAGLSIRQTGDDLDIDMCDRTTWRKHTLDANQIEDGHYRFLLYSGSNALISGTEGALIKMTLTASTGFDFHDKRITIDNALLVSPDQKEVKPGAYEYALPDPSGIRTIAAERNARSAVYTLSGQRLAAPRKGLNIVDGRKVVVK